MRTVEDHLVAGVSVNGGHDAALNRSIIIQRLSHRCKAVGGAGSRGNDFVVRSQGLFVYAVNDGFQVVAGRSGNNNFLCARVKVCLRFFFRGVEAGAFENNVNTDFAPGKVFCVFHCIDGDFFAVYNNVIVAGFNGVFCFTDFAAIAALSGIILQKMSKHFGIGQIVDGNNLIAFCAEHLSERKTTDSAETVNSNFY